MEFTQEHLEEMVVGKAIKPRAVFYEQAILDHNKSREEGRRVYSTRVFIKLVAPGTTDWQPYAAQREDFQKFPEEYEYFQNNKQGERTAGIDIVPGLSLSHKQELLDTGHTDIKKLANAINLPAHLQYAQKSAMTLVNTIEEMRNAKQETRTEEGRGPAEAENVPEVHRQGFSDHVGRPEPARVQSACDGGPPRIVEDRRQHAGPVAEKQLIDDWKVSLNWVH